MNIIGQKVRNAKYGVGEVISQDSKYIMVYFESMDQTSKYAYPEAFRKFLMAENSDIQEAVLKEIESIDKEAQEKERKAKEEKLKQQELERRK